MKERSAEATRGQENGPLIWCAAEVGIRWLACWVKVDFGSIDIFGLLDSFEHEVSCTCDRHKKSLRQVFRALLVVVFEGLWADYMAKDVHECFGDHNHLWVRLGRAESLTVALIAALAWRHGDEDGG